MNFIINDRGESIVAVGAPCSIERAKCQYPTLIGDLTKVRSKEIVGDSFARDDSAVTIATLLHARGILLAGVVPDSKADQDSKLAMRSLLVASGYSDAQALEVFGQLRILNQDADRAMREGVAPLTQAPVAVREHAL